MPHPPQGGRGRPVAGVLVIDPDAGVGRCPVGRRRRLGGPGGFGGGRSRRDVAGTVLLGRGLRRCGVRGGSLLGRDRVATSCPPVLRRRPGRLGGGRPGWGRVVAGLLPAEGGGAGMGTLLPSGGFLGARWLPAAGGSALGAGHPAVSLLGLWRRSRPQLRGRGSSREVRLVVPGGDDGGARCHPFLLRDRSSCRRRLVVRVRFAGGGARSRRPGSARRVLLVGLPVRPLGVPGGPAIRGGPTQDGRCLPRREPRGGGRAHHGQHDGLLVGTRAVRLRRNLHLGIDEEIRHRQPFHHSRPAKRGVAAQAQLVVGVEIREVGQGGWAPAAVAATDQGDAGQHHVVVEQRGEATRPVGQRPDTVDGHDGQVPPQPRGQPVDQDGRLLRAGQATSQVQHHPGRGVRQADLPARVFGQRLPGAGPDVEASGDRVSLEFVGGGRARRDERLPVGAAPPHREPERGLTATEEPPTRLAGGASRVEVSTSDPLHIGLGCDDVHPERGAELGGPAGVRPLDVPQFGDGEPQLVAGPPRLREAEPAGLPQQRPQVPRPEDGRGHDHDGVVGDGGQLPQEPLFLLVPVSCHPDQHVRSACLEEEVTVGFGPCAGPLVVRRLHQGASRFSVFPLTGAGSVSQVSGSPLLAGQSR